MEKLNLHDMYNICPTCGCKTVHKKIEKEHYRIEQGMFCDNCEEWVIHTNYSKLSEDNTQYRLTFSLQGAEKRARKEILSMCPDSNLTQQMEQENIIVFDNAEALYGVIQRLLGFGISYEVEPSYPYEVKAWDGYMDRDFVEELAKLNPGLDIEGVLRAQEEDIMKLEQNNPD